MGRDVTAMSAGNPRTWLSERIRGTNWFAAGIAGALQLGFLAVLMTMGIIPVSEPRRDKPLVTVLATAPQQKPAAPAPPQPQEATKPVVQPRADTVAPPVKISVSTAPPVAAAVERVPDPAPAAPAPAAPVAPVAAAAPAAAAGPITVSNLATTLVSGPPPRYPVESRHKREEGTVVLWLVISKDGRVTQVSVQQSSGFPKLDEAATAAVRKWRWSPSMREGRPVEIAGAVRIPFVLRKS